MPRKTGDAAWKRPGRGQPQRQHPLKGKGKSRRSGRRTSGSFAGQLTGRGPGGFMAGPRSRPRRR